MFMINTNLTRDKTLDYQKFNCWSQVYWDDFIDHKWQLKNTITTFSQLKSVVQGLLSEQDWDAIEFALLKAPMNLRITPYIMSLINWDTFFSDPIRKQFLPIKHEMVADHPFCSSDSLKEESASPTPQLVHRYPDKALFLPLTVCPVYCTFCTRSRLVGGSTNTKTKDLYGPRKKNWADVVKYLYDNPQIEDIIISGGDAFMMSPQNLRLVCQTIFNIPTIKRVRLATKGLSSLPSKIITDKQWLNVIVEMNDFAASNFKEFAIHTHINHPREITAITHQALRILCAKHITVRNQSVLLKGVNDDYETMSTLIKKLSSNCIQPYYVYLHDMVENSEHNRTTLKTAVELEKQVRGLTAGYNTPLFICDLAHGGGKRDIHSCEYYDEVTGISIWKSPVISSEKHYLHFDPIHLLSHYGQALWRSDKAIDYFLDQLPSSINLGDIDVLNQESI